MRKFLIALAVTCAASAPSFAQEPAVPAPEAAAPALAPEAAAPALAPEHAGARDVLQALLIDSGIMGLAVDQAISQMLPDLRNSMSSSRLGQSISPEARQRMDAYINTMPTILREEIDAVLPEVVNTSAPRVTALFNAREMEDIAEFFRDERLRTLMARMIADPNAASTFTRDEERALRRFAGTRGGRAFGTKSDQLMGIVRDGLESISAPLQARLAVRAITGICGALAEECPPGVRALVPAPT